MQSKVLDIKYQTLVSTVGITVQFLAQWLISVLLVRLDGYEAAGIFSLAMSISNVFAYFANYGLRNYQITDARNTYTDLQYLLARAQMVLAAAVACGLYLWWAPGYAGQEKQAIFCYLLYNLFNTVGDTLLGSIQVRNHLEISGYSCAAKGLVCFLLFMGGRLAAHAIVPALAGMALGSLLVVLCYDLPLYRRCLPRFSPCTLADFRRAWGLWPACFTLMLSQVVPIITTAVPRRTIQSLLGVESLGVFSSVFTPTVVITTLAPAVVTAFLPRIAACWESGRAARVRRMVFLGLGVFAGGTLLTIAVVFLCGRPVMQFIFGAEILAHFSLLYWAVLATVCSALTSFFNGVLTAIRHTGCIAVLTIGAMALTSLCARSLVTCWGINGAAYLQILVYALQAAVQLALILKYTHRRS